MKSVILYEFIQFIFTFMITIAQAVEQAIAGSPLYGEAILSGIVNFSAIARKIQPTIEAKLFEPVTEGAITIALKRYAAHLKKDHTNVADSYAIRTISMRSDLTVLIYQNSPSLQHIHQKILQMNIHDDAFIHFAQGSRESSFVVSDKPVADLKKLTEKETLIEEHHALTAISVRMPPEVMHIAGVFAPFVQVLGWQKISVYQIVSHFTEITFLVSNQDADRAFTLIKSISKL